MQGESIGLGYPFQSGVRAIQWTDEANHEGLVPLLRTDGDTVGHRTAEADPEVSAMLRVDQGFTRF